MSNALRLELFSSTFILTSDVRRATLTIVTDRDVDRNWFLDRAIKEYGSLRTMASKHMTTGMGGPNNIHRLSKVINGKVDPTVHEVLQLAELFRVDIHEVLRKLGYHVRRRG